MVQFKKYGSRKCHIKAYAGIDLHSTNNYIGIINTKNGNKYLSWAYVEAAHHAKRSYPYVKRFFQRKEARQTV